SAFRARRIRSLAGAADAKAADRPARPPRSQLVCAYSLCPSGLFVLKSRDDFRRNFLPFQAPRIVRVLSRPYPRFLAFDRQFVALVKPVANQKTAPPELCDRSFDHHL